MSCEIGTNIVAQNDTFLQMVKLYILYHTAKLSVYIYDHSFQNTKAYPMITLYPTSVFHCLMTSNEYYRARYS